LKKKLRLRFSWVRNVRNDYEKTEAEETMKHKVIVSIACMLLTISLTFSPCAAAELIGEVTSAFNAKTGKLILLTSEGEMVCYLADTAVISVKPKLSTEPVPADWEFLRNNLFAGTKVRIDAVDRTVTSIVVLEVPQ